VVEAYGLSNAGPVRKTNEDSFISDPGLQLFMVADGMGGHAAGEIASSLAVETITGFIRRTEEDADCSWILLCSDGLHGVIDDTDLEGMLNRAGRPRTSCPTGSTSR
jgi:serine/threonine protein phosphatase PrpC